ATSHHHAGVAERSQRTTPPTTIEPPRPRPTDLARSFAHPRKDCDESPEVVSHRCPPTNAKGRSTARKVRNSRTRNRIVEAHEGLRQRDRFAFSREHADRITSPDVRRQFRDAGDGEIRSMAEGVDSGILDDDSRKVPQEVLDRPQDLSDGTFVPVLLCKD